MRSPISNFCSRRAWKIKNGFCSSLRLVSDIFDGPSEAENHKFLLRFPMKANAIWRSCTSINAARELPEGDSSSAYTVAILSFAQLWRWFGRISWWYCSVGYAIFSCKCMDPSIKFYGFFVVEMMEKKWRGCQWTSRSFERKKFQNENCLRDKNWIDLRFKSCEKLKFIRCFITNLYPCTSIHKKHLSALFRHLCIAN